MSGATAPYRWVVLGVGAFGAAAFAGTRLGPAALAPSIRDSYGLTLPEVGVVFTAVALGVMLMLIPWGMLTDRVGERWVMTGGLLASAAALVGAASVESFALFVAYLALAGMAGCTTTVAGGRAIMGWFGRRERGLALGIRQMALPAGGAIASLALPQAAQLGGLDAALLTLAGWSVVGAAATAVWMREPPPGPVPPPLLDAPPPLRDGRIWRLGLGSALLVLGQGAFMGFLVLFLHDERGLTATGAAAAFAALQVGAAVGRIAAGRISDRRERRIGMLRTTARANVVLLPAVALLAGGPGLLLYPVLTVASILSMTWNGLAFTAAGEISGRARAGTAMSIQNTAINFGAAVSPILFGAVVAATSWPFAFAAMGLAPLLAWFVLAPLVDDEEARAEARDQRLSPKPPPVRIAT